MRFRILLLIIIGFLNDSCIRIGCDCFDEGELNTQINFRVIDKDYPIQDQDTSEYFEMKEIDSCILIITEKENLNNHIDSLYLIDININAYDYRIILQENSINRYELDLNYESYNYLIINEIPYLYFAITDIKTSFDLSGTKLSRCRCKKNEHVELLLNGELITKEDFPIIIKKES